MPRYDDALSLRFKSFLIDRSHIEDNSSIMRFVTFLAITGLAVVASAKPTKKQEAPAQIEVTLTPKTGSFVKVSVKNVGKEKFDFFQRGSLLDENPVHKFQIQSASGQLAFLYTHDDQILTSR